MSKKTIRDIDVQGKKVIVRCDFNVPLDDKGEITDDIRITSALPTIQYLIENKAKVILMSHMGRPDGEANMKYTLKPVAERLVKLLDREKLHRFRGRMLAYNLYDKGPPCRRCGLRGICDGFTKQYARRFGFREATPYQEKVNSPSFFIKHQQKVRDE